MLIPSMHFPSNSFILLGLIRGLRLRLTRTTILYELPFALSYIDLSYIEQEPQ